MTINELLAGRLARLLDQVGRTSASFTIDLPRRGYLQGAGFGEAVLIEVASNASMGRTRRLTKAAEARLVALGFNEPTEDLPNWWIEMAPDDRDAIRAAAEATVAAALACYGATPLGMARQLEMDVELFDGRHPEYSREGLKDGPTTLTVKTLNGEIELTSNGTALRQREAWTQYPVHRWGVNSKGRITIDFTRPGGDDDWAGWTGFVENTPDAHTVLEAFRPSDDELALLRMRLAVQEGLWLEAATTGEFRDEWYQTLRRADEAARALRPQKVSAWRHAPYFAWPERLRFEASDAVFRALDMRQSADTSSQYRGDTLDMLRALQAWVTLTPWRERFELAIAKDDGRSALVPLH